MQKKFIVYFKISIDIRLLKFYLIDARKKKMVFHQGTNKKIGGKNV